MPGSASDLYPNPNTPRGSCRCRYSVRCHGAPGTTEITGGNNMTSDKPLLQEIAHLLGKRLAFWVLESATANEILSAYADEKLATVTGFPVDEWAAGRVRATKVGLKK